MNDFFREKRIFLSKFLQEGKRFGSLWPSTQAIADAMTKHINPAIPQTIVELGAGTGAVTKVALAKMHPDSTLICVEADPAMGAFLQRYNTQAHIVIGCAKNITQEMDKLGLKQIDVMISGLALPSLSNNIITAVLDCYAHFASEETPFCQLTLVPWLYLKFYNHLFNKVEFNFVLRSVPPGGVYYCWGVKPDFKEHLPVDH